MRVVIVGAAAAERELDQILAARTAALNELAHLADEAKRFANELRRDGQKGA